MQLISQGAEARIYEMELFERKCIVKERFSKKYRLKVLDEKLCKARMVQESRCYLKCRKSGVNTPCIYMMDAKKYRFYMEKLLGLSLKQFFASQMDKGGYSKRAMEMAYDIGKQVAKMHDVDIVHGDLTTSNMMFRKADNTELTLIDFGLASSKPINEDKAVDLYVMERAMYSTHVGSEPLVGEVLRAYKAHSRVANQTLLKLSAVRSRGPFDVWTAAKSGHLDHLHTFITQNKVQQTRWSGVTPLHRAASHNQLEAMQLLLEHNANVDAKTVWGQYTPLHLACKAGHEQAAKMLLDHNANWLLKDKYKTTPLRWAVQHGHASMGHRLDKHYKHKGLGVKTSSQSLENN